MQPNHQHADDVVLGLYDRCQNCDLCPLVSRQSVWRDDRYVKVYASMANGQNASIIRDQSYYNPCYARLCYAQECMSKKFAINRDVRYGMLFLVL
jgi:hypothetical protein